jgi:hypothetical protein
MENFLKYIFVLFVCGTSVIFLDGCASLTGKAKNQSYLFGTFQIDDRTEGKETEDVPFYFAFRDYSSDDEFIYDPKKLYLFKCAYSPEGSFQSVKVPAGEYRVYSLMRISEDQTSFETYYDGVTAETELAFVGKVAVRPGEALYLGDYLITYSRTGENTIEVSWSIKNELERDSTSLRGKGNKFSKIKIKSLFDGKRNKTSRE